jgi:peptide deformylase
MRFLRSPFPLRWVGLALVLPSVACIPAPMIPNTPPPAPPLSVPSPATPPIVQVGAPLLRARAAEVPLDLIPTAEFQQLVATMIATMRQAPGVGLAAPQIGVGWRVFVLEDRPALISKLSEVEQKERERQPFAVRVFVNPVLRPIGEARAMFFEGCLSVHGFVGLVERSREVEVSGYDEHGTAQTWRVSGWPARILAHELDHLDGTLYIDHMERRSFSTADQAKALYAGKPIAEIRRLLGL